MKNTVVTFLLSIICLTSCDAQSGGLGFWQPPPFTPGDSVKYMYDGPFLVREEGGEHYLYSIARNMHALVKYKIYPKLGSGVVLLGTPGVPGVLEDPIEIREAGGHLFILDRAGRRITRMQISNPSNTRVLYDNFLAMYRLSSFTPLLPPGAHIDSAKLYGLYFNQNLDPFHKVDGQLVPGVSAMYPITNSHFLLTSIAPESNTMKLISGTPRVANTYPSIAFGRITWTMHNGVPRIVTTVSVNGDGASYILDSDNLFYGYLNFIDDHKVLITRMPTGMITDVLNAATPSIDIGNRKGVVATTLYEGYGRFTSIRWSNGDVTPSPLWFNTYVWSPIIGSTMNSVYVSMGSAQPEEPVLRRIDSDGNTVFLRALFKYIP